MRRATGKSTTLTRIAWISIHALLAESDSAKSTPEEAKRYFYPRSPCGERLRNSPALLGNTQFLSTLSLRRATEKAPYRVAETQISIHALLAESDTRVKITCNFKDTFLSTLSLRRATMTHPLLCNAKPAFLSTLSLRRATCYSLRHSAQDRHFYPRSPCGERRYLGAGESGHVRYFYPRSPCGERRRHGRRLGACICISIHALLAESDHTVQIVVIVVNALFLSTLSLRRATIKKGRARRPGQNFYPRSPCGERLTEAQSEAVTTLISIHALLAESDQSRAVSHQTERNFYPRSPCGERQRANSFPHAPPKISIHALLAESD